MTTLAANKPVTDAFLMRECADCVEFADKFAKEAAEYDAIGGTLNKIRAKRLAKEAARHYRMAESFMAQAFA